MNEIDPDIQKMTKQMERIYYLITNFELLDHYDIKNILENVYLLFDYIINKYHYLISKNKYEIYKSIIGQINNSLRCRPLYLLL